MPQTLIEELRDVVDNTSGVARDRSRRRKLHSKAVKSMLAPSLAKIHDYLSEFKQHLATLDPETDVDLSLRQIGVIKDLQQTHYKLMSGTDPLKSVILKAELIGQQPVKIRLSIRRQCRHLDRKSQAGRLDNFISYCDSSLYSGTDNLDGNRA